MKHSYLIRAFVVLSLPLTSFIGSGWVPFSVDEQLQVLLPKPAEEMNMEKLTGRTIPNTRVFMSSDSVGLYQIMQVKMPPEQAATLEGEENREQYYSGVINGMLRSQKDGVLLERTQFTTAAGPGIEVKYRARHNSTGKLTVKYSRSLVASGVGYAFNFIPRDLTDTAGISGSAQRRRFFSSIQIKPVSKR
ncbi:hypothetical protein [Hymenobacter wooponensis]|uniref:Uncharacterized protein n=1 Tax=Hymenobacter wooponensis TaxID=1525360 RepID=A0A4Z0MLC2_9BACT|nr:hypothetical protein [Hymenobacter wooponensis]TGD80286.1 hypothetical protein EU557_10600 [Hymenobacter wooponensis]